MYEDDYPLTAGGKNDEPNAEAYEAVVQAINQHQIRPPIDRRFRFKDVKAAYQAQSSPDLFGKIVIDVV